MNRYIHIRKAEAVDIYITRYTDQGRKSRAYQPSLPSQARLSAAIQHAPAVIEVKNNVVYITVDK